MIYRGDVWTLRIERGTDLRSAHGSTRCVARRPEMQWPECPPTTRRRFATAACVAILLGTLADWGRG